jgi:hypothetical protein
MYCFASNIVIILYIYIYVSVYLHTFLGVANPSPPFRQKIIFVLARIKCRLENSYQSIILV